MTKKRKVNLGCGSDIRDDWINVDHVELEGVDIVHDLNNLPLPFEDDSVDIFLCKDILEHVKFIPLLKELHRCLKKDGVLKIQVPHFTSTNNYIDPTHVNMFSYRTFEFFVKGKRSERNYYFDFYFSEIQSKKITFETQRLFGIHTLVEKIVNLHNGFLYRYEDTFLSRIFPAQNIEITLIK